VALVTGTTFVSLPSSVKPGAFILRPIKNKLSSQSNSTYSVNFQGYGDSPILRLPQKTGVFQPKNKITSNGKGIILQTISYLSSDMSFTSIPKSIVTVSSNRKSYNDGRDPNAMVFSNFTVAPGANRCLVICITAAGSASSPTYTPTWSVNGRTYTFTSFIQNTENRTSIWHLINPETGTGTVSIGVSPTNYWEASCSYFTGVDQSTPMDNGLSYTGSVPGSTTYTTTASFTGTANNLAIAVMKWWDNSGKNVTPSNTQIFSESSDGAHKGAAQYKYTQNGADSLSWTWSSTPLSITWFIVVAQLRAQTNVPNDYSHVLFDFPKSSSFLPKIITKYFLGQASLVNLMTKSSSFVTKNKNKLQSISPQIVQNISLKSFSDIPALQKTSGFFVQTGVPIVKTKLTVSQIFSVMNFVQSISSSFYIKIKGAGVPFFITIASDMAKPLTTAVLSASTYASRAFRRITFWT